MNWLDILIIVVSGIIGFIGYRMGILKVVALVVGIVVGVVLGSRFNDEVADFLSRWISSPGTAKIAAYAAILVLGLLAATLVASLMRKVLGMLLLGWVDKFVGLALGVFVSFVMFSALLSFASNLSLMGFVGSDVIKGSTLGSFLADKFDVVLEATKLVPKDFNFN